jgi:putative ABC transport system permease protein
MRGRTYTEADDDSKLGVAVINQSFAKKFWGGEDAFGKHFSIGKASDGLQAGKDFEIIGVVEDGKYNDLTEDPQPYLFLNMSQFRDADATFIVASAGNAASLSMPVRRLMREHSMTVTGLVTLREFMRSTMFTNRLAAQLISAMCGLGVLLAAIGLYGVIAFVVRRRTHEIGIRMALGASREDILGLFLRRGLFIALLGLAVGIAGGLTAGKLLASLLFEVGARDPLTYLLGSLLLLGVAAAATYLPARRATRVEPMEALRYE